MHTIHLLLLSLAYFVIANANREVRVAFLGLNGVRTDNEIQEFRPHLTFDLHTPERKKEDGDVLEPSSSAGPNLESTTGAACTGNELGQVCHYRGLVFVDLMQRLKIGDAALEDTQKFIEDSFRKYPKAYWRICNIKDHNDFTVHRSIAETCMDMGAIINNGRNIQYGRSNTGTLMGRYCVLEIDPNRSEPTRGRYSMPPEKSTALREQTQLTCSDIPHRTQYTAVLCTFNPNAFSPDMASCSYQVAEEIIVDFVRSHQLEISKSRMFGYWPKPKIEKKEKIEEKEEELGLEDSTKPKIEKKEEEPRLEVSEKKWWWEKNWWIKIGCISMNIRPW